MGQPSAEESTPVCVKNVVDIGVAVATIPKDKLQLTQILCGLEIRRHVIGGTRIGADGCVQRVSRQLTDVIDVISYSCQFHTLC